MQIISDIHQIRKILKDIRQSGKIVAFVPTMGYLHQGHISLMEKAKKVADFVVCSIFVNPMQFGPNEDFERYPRNEKRDFELCESVGVDLVFLPKITDMYPIGHASKIVVSKVTEVLEGEKRPGHFDGVATIVAKLFNIISPHKAIFGQKDYQQSLLIKKMVKDLNFDIEIIVAPCIRSADGLALSSRNVYLREEERQIAPALFMALEKTKQLIENGETDRKIINAFMLKHLKKPEFSGRLKVDYAVSLLAEDLSDPDYFLAKDEVVLLIAVHLGKTRLIDNTKVTIPSKITF